MFWYPTDNGYVNLEKAVSIELEQTPSKYILCAKFSPGGKDKVNLKSFSSREEALQLLDWLVKELNKNNS